MPPKVDVKILIGKRDNAIHALKELFEEFEAIFAIKPQLERLESTFNLIESKYRSIKKQQETIADRLVEEGTTGEDESTLANQTVGDKVKTDYLQIVKVYTAYQKEIHPPEASPGSSETLEAMTSAVKQMAETMGSKSKASGLERLPVPSWDGRRRSYSTWKKEFNHWMTKYSQDKDEQLQRFRKAMPKGLWWTDQVKTSKDIDRAWDILDVEFADKRKLMDELLTGINNQKLVKRDSKSLTRYATLISGYVNDMEDNDCSVSSSSEAPFFMSQLLSKLDSRDNADFGREMKRNGKEENVSNLIDWLHQEASIRSRGKQDIDEENAERSSRESFHKRSDNHAVSSGTPEDETTCPLGCPTKHLLAACPYYQTSTVNERWEIVKQNKRCRKCLKSHHTNDCRKPDGTSCDKCKKNHHRSLHNEKRDSLLSNLNPTALPFPSQATHDQNTTDNHNIQMNTSCQNREVKTVVGMCPIQKVKVRDTNGELVEVLALLDSGSNTSLLSKGAAGKLGLTGPKTHLTMNLAGGEKRSEVAETFEITVVSSVEEDIEKTLQVYTVRRPCSNARTISRRSIESYPHLKPISDKLHLSGGAVDLLLGTDFTDAFVDVHTILGESGEPIAKRNCFGWYALGQLDPKSMNSSGIHSVDVGTASIMEDVNKLLQQDLMGIKPTQFCTCSENELRENKFVKSLSRSTTLVDGRVQVKMPWKEEGPPRRSNYNIAIKRMYAAEKSFEKKGCIKVVDDEVQKLVDQGFVIKIPPEQVDHTQPEWYLPLQAVFTPEKTTKVRLVFDASSKGHDGLSLNDHLEKGPNYINQLPSVLTAWRWDEVAYTGDVRKMFNQVVVHPDDQVYHRFLWRENASDPPSVYQWLRLSFGDKPAPDIASNSINTLAKASQFELPEAARELQEHVYVDDIGGSRPTVNEAKQVTNGIDVILGKGQFQIKTWHSNNKEIDQSHGERFTDLLGHRWDKQEDKLSFKKREIVGKFETFSKRSCLALLAQLWDPIGLVSPVTIKFRTDLQELWSSGFGWDDVLPENDQTKWMKNLQIMNRLLTFEFDRKLKPSNAVGGPEIHGFSDGGEQGFGAVIFLRWKLDDGSYRCVPVMIKSFVAPLKKKSIPRLELLGCLALSRMCDTCQKTLEFARIKEAKRFLWVDSTTALSWIRTPPKEFRPFVSARVAEIQETVGTEDFLYVRSSCNPADALTRGIEAERLADWLEGPPFLKQPDIDWPKFQEDVRNFPEGVVETMKEKKPSEKPLKRDRRIKGVRASSVTDKKDNAILSHLLAACSSFSKARRTLAYVLRFVQNTRKTSVRNGSISVEELTSSEKRLFKWCQLHLDVATLDKMFIAKEDQDGLLRVHGRLEDIRSLPDDMRNPILLPRNHPLVCLLLTHLHLKRGHCGYKSLMHEARKKFWIIGLRDMSKHLTNECITCRKLRKKPLDQLMGQIPSLRVAAGFPAFSNTAIDMFGPVHIRLNRKTLKEAQVVIFTCMTSRAVHLELVSDKSTAAFLMAFRRFACLRGHPNNCWSDCGTNFVGAQGYLNEIIQGWDIPRIQSVLSEEFTCDFKWQWNIPHASHQNGVVESLIKSVRQGLNSTCKNQTFTEEQWRTFLAEISYMINSRPLYPSSDSVWESPPVTPNDIIIGQHSAPPQPEPEDRVNPRHLLRSTQSRIKEFWNCWMKYFAPNLLPRNKWFRPRENVQVGDLVLELDPKHKRCQWKMALITDTYPGDDGLVRKVRIKTEVGEYDRPIHKLCLIATRQELDAESQ